ncbi:TylF/MycF/NovP-related O-methyltransferase [Rhodovastum atsumiense]|uniref:Asparagine synthase n=1 Tax=Rhodovastum atsumiense TaxID=504468 RepID=A0A5M6INF6_9PROT|nr:TylF/MycF/NovP-related O-methyltransferase [Rhodovastum atsumiense]KAA5609792.1 asparagine synthase [Rhodovastum atsumiense]
MDAAPRPIPDVGGFLRKATLAARLGRIGVMVRRGGLTYLSAERLLRIRQELKRLQRDNVPGEALEFGVALGGSAIMIARHVRGQRRFLGYDVFGLIPPPGAKDPQAAHQRYAEITSGHSAGIGGQLYYGYRNDLMGEVSGRLASFGVPVDGHSVTLVQGRFEETVPATLPDQVAFAHIDCDWHDPVAHILASLLPRLSPGAAIVIDDYEDYGGCRSATDAFLAAHPEMEMMATSPNALLRRRTTPRQSAS